jgi:histidinol-phosphate aminotransferase
MFELEKILRPHIKNLIPYSSARNEFMGEASIYLDANENNHGSPVALSYNRYPDPLQMAVKEKLSKIKGVPPPNIFLGNGSDEAIDILFRAFCRPGIDNVIIPSPTYGMYRVSADINDVGVRTISLTQSFQLNVDEIAKTISLLNNREDGATKLIFICSPNNPTGNSFVRADIEIILNNFEGIVVIDEAYINFSKQKSFISELKDYPNLVILQTLSKAWGLAGLRLGMAFASEKIISIFNKVKAPYNVNQASQELALEALDQVAQVNIWIKEIVKEREKVMKAITQFPFVEEVYPSDANFILVKTKDPSTIYKQLLDAGIVVRDRSKMLLCAGCLRITIGTEAENMILLNTLKRLENA